MPSRETPAAERREPFPFGHFAYVAFALGHVETTAKGTDVRLEGLKALNEIGAVLLDVRSVCETLPGKLNAGNVEGALTELEWLAARVHGLMEAKP